jgi:hypothetical protein
MIAIMPHAEPDGDEDHLDREGGANGGDSVAHRRVQGNVDLLRRHGPMGARMLRLYADSLIHLVDAFNARDRHAFEEAADECVDCLHDLIEAKRGSKKRGF